MTRMDLPGPVVFTPAEAADPADVFGGMSVGDMVEIVAAMDPEAGIVAAFTARHLQAIGGRHNESLFRDDAPVGCCQNAASLLSHRVSVQHVAYLHADLLTTAVNEYIVTERKAGQKVTKKAAFDQIIDDIESACQQLITDLGDLALMTGDSADTDTELMYAVPLYALDVPDERIDAYWDARLTWPEALTFEVYGPPSSDAALAALRLSAPVAKVRVLAERGHLRLLG